MTLRNSIYTSIDQVCVFSKFWNQNFSSYIILYDMKEVGKHVVCSCCLWLDLSSSVKASIAASVVVYIVILSSASVQGIFRHGKTSGPYISISLFGFINLYMWYNSGFYYWLCQWILKSFGCNSLWHWSKYDTIFTNTQFRSFIQLLLLPAVTFFYNLWGFIVNF